MFGDLLGDMEARQKELQEKLSKINVSESINDEAVIVTASALGEIIDININKDKIDFSDMDELQDLMIETVNRVLAAAKEIEAAETQKLMNDMMPPGLGNLFGQ